MISLLCLLSGKAQGGRKTKGTRLKADRSAKWRPEAYTCLSALALLGLGFERSRWLRGRDDEGNKHDGQHGVRDRGIPVGPALLRAAVGTLLQQFKSVRVLIPKAIAMIDMKSPVDRCAVKPPLAGSCG